MSDFDWRRMLNRGRQTVVTAVSPHALRLWNNALFSKDRQARPLPPNLMTRTLPIAAGVLMLLPIVAWVIDIRLISAIVLGICLAAAALPALTAPFLGAGTAAAARDQSTFTSMSPADAALGSAMVALWRLRWMIVVGLALTPALMISLLRLDVATFSAYRDAVLALGSAAPPDQVQLLLPGGGIPYIRLLIRDLSAGLLPWAVLPVAGALGLSGVLFLDDVTFGQMAGLIATFIVLIVTAGLWAWLSLTPIFAGMFEIIRFALLAGLLAGLLGLAYWVSKQNARLLLIR